MARRAWSEVEEEILLTNLTSLVDQGVWQGKIKKWKRDYFYLDAILQIPGFGWNPNENKLVVQNDVWNEFVRVSNFEFV
ncbi:hypothetical protein RHMOL_Rhmol02G0281600 [Rhododendron molle]|uniref:Uncharacterized protein n=2 Tax=Rhododendron molle TaxID=49168 RepID=A0ACC0L845_RHOML|nr:hypothetical protein RHMOL_Rhmol13G0146000 [Rhododendron molle]KAI8569465.1 hypothetical protein RHMOL_Rhmol02G0281600 [Rhododendron molle]